MKTWISFHKSSTFSLFLLAILASTCKGVWDFETTDMVSTTFGTVTLTLCGMLTFYGTVSGWYLIGVELYSPMESVFDDPIRTLKQGKPHFGFSLFQYVASFVGIIIPLSFVFFQGMMFTTNGAYLILMALMVGVCSPYFFWITWLAMPEHDEQYV